MEGDRGTGHDTTRGQQDGWWCVEPMMSGTVMEDKSSEGGERVGMKVDGWAVERDGKTDSSKTT